MVNNILKEYFNKFYVVYLDNILIFFNNKKKYIGYIIRMLKTLKKIKFWIKLKKYTFYINKVEYLRFIIIS